MVSREELLQVYAQKESFELALANLEEMKGTASSGDVDYSEMKARHADALEKARQTLKSLRMKLRREFNTKTREIEELNGELSHLYTSLKNGELSTQEHGNKSIVVKEKIAQLEEYLVELELLLGSRSAADLKEKAVSPPGKAAASVEPIKVAPVAEKTVQSIQDFPQQSIAAKSGRRKGSIVRRHPVISAVAGILIICLVLWAFLAPGETPVPVICPTEGSPAPEFTLDTLDGKNLSLSELKGKVVMLYFWKFDCTSCDREMWNILDVYDRWSKRDFIVLAVNEGDTLTTVKEYAANRKLPFPVLLDSKGLLKKQYCLPDRLPASIFIDAEGNISTIKTGAFEGTAPMESIVSRLVVQKGVDIEPPLISNVTVSGISEDMAIINWVTSEPATTQLGVLLPQGFPSPESQSGLTRNHSVTVSGLTPVTTYQFKIVARDGSGNESTLTDAGQKFTTLASIPVGLEIGKRAPDFTLQTVDGQAITLSSLKGKVVMVNFWSKSCSSCLREIPHMQEVYDKKLSDRFVMLALHGAEGIEEVKDFVTKWRIGFTVLLDPQDRTFDLYHIEHFPMTYFVDGQGIIRQIKDGLLVSPTEIENIIKSLLKNP